MNLTDIKKKMRIMSFKQIFLLFIIIFCFSQITGQESIVPLNYNPKKNGQTTKTNKSHYDKNDTVLKLPFFEDFSYKGPYPDNNLWVDSFVYINSYYPKHPVSIGVATFDAYDQHGKVYGHASENRYQFVADHLTSHKLRLDSIFKPEQKELGPNDSVYISFYYQPQGISNAPADRDSLVLEFLHTPGHHVSEKNENGNDTTWVEDKWVSIWSTEGETLSNFSNDTLPYFKRVMIPITDTEYFRDDFQFRFKNYASFPIEKTPTNYSGNRSIWNIDYITIDYNRSLADTSYYDITFAKPAESMLSRYTAMPWSHYIQNPDSHLKETLNVAIKNLHNEEHNYTYRYFIKDELQNIIRTYSGGDWNIGPFYEYGYQDFEPHSNPLVLNDPFPVEPAEKKHFQIVHAIKEGATGDNRRRNDTIKFDQIFHNYFAYDNGVPNASYIITGFEPQSATKFVMSHLDTLYGIDLYINQTLNNVDNGPFKFVVWESLEPEEIVYESEIIIPEHDDERGSFFSYILDEFIELEGSFYVGWRQTSPNILNVGYDLTSSAGNNIFYNIDGQWFPSMYDGAIMIRPIVSQKPDGTNIKNT